MLINTRHSITIPFVAFSVSESPGFLHERERLTWCISMEDYKKRLATTLAETGALFFDEGLLLKDGRPTPYFVNLGMFRTGRLSMEMGSFFAEMMLKHGLEKNTDIILGPSYKGSSIALATAIALYAHHGYDLLFDYDRKESKAHGEASRSTSLFVNRTPFEGCRIFIVDDVATSMGTKFELLEKIKAEAAAGGISVMLTGVGIAIDREQTTAVYDDKGCVVLDRKGDNAIRNFASATGITVYAVAGIREIIAYLYRERVPVMIKGEWRPIDENAMALFDSYMNMYGFDENGP
jgi:orotate phosphoribosyltransferase